MASTKHSIMIGTVIVLLGWWSSPSPALACSCVADVSIAEQFENATTVFVGKARSVIQSGGEYEVTFENVHPWKGNATDGVVIHTGQGGGDCGFPFEDDREYIVYGYGVNTIEANICNGTQLSTQALKEELDHISATTESPDTADAETGGNLLVTSAIAIASFLAGVFVTRLAVRTKY